MAGQINLDLLQDREISLMGNLMYVGEDVLHAIELLRKKTFDLADVVTAEYDIEEAGAAGPASDDPEHVKVLVTVAPLA